MLHWNYGLITSLQFKSSLQFTSTQFHQNETIQISHTIFFYTAQRSQTHGGGHVCVCMCVQISRGVRLPPPTTHTHKCVIWHSTRCEPPEGPELRLFLCCSTLWLLTRPSLITSQHTMVTTKWTHTLQPARSPEVQLLTVVCVETTGRCMYVLNWASVIKPKTWSCLSIGDNTRFKHPSYRVHISSDFFCTFGLAGTLSSKSRPKPSLSKHFPPIA